MTAPREYHPRLRLSGRQMLVAVELATGERYEDAPSYRTIAESLGMSPETVRSHVNGAVRRLRPVYDWPDYLPPPGPRLRLWMWAISAQGRSYVAYNAARLPAKKTSTGRGEKAAA